MAHQGPLITALVELDKEDKPELLGTIIGGVVNHKQEPAYAAVIKGQSRFNQVIVCNDLT